MTPSPDLLASRRRLLLDRAVDYAGLFPPAGLGMPEAVGNYLAYRTSTDAWALGRFVVPVSRFPELEALLPAPGPDGAPAPIPLSALVGAGTVADVDRTQEFNRRTAVHGALVEAVEAKAGSVAEVRTLLGELPSNWLRYVEVPVSPHIGGLLDLVGSAGAFAKLRTGGTTPDSIPEPAALAAALVALAVRRLPFKATAGLHHPLTGEYPLTYAPGAAHARMYGFLNLMAAAGLAFSGAAPAEVERALLTLDEAALGAVDAARPRFLHGFGSCSFREPLDEFPRSSIRIVA